MSNEAGSVSIKEIIIINLNGRKNWQGFFGLGMNKVGIDTYMDTMESIIKSNPARTLKLDS